MKNIEIHPGLVCLALESGNWVPATVKGRHKTTGVSRPGPRLFDVELADGSRVPKRVQQLRRAPSAAPAVEAVVVQAPAAPAPVVTTADVFRHQLQGQHGRTLRAAEDLLSNVQQLVERLRAGEVPTSGLNVSTVGFVIADHAQLVCLRDALKVVEDDREGA